MSNILMDLHMSWWSFIVKPVRIPVRLHNILRVTSTTRKSTRAAIKRHLSNTTRGIDIHIANDMSFQGTDNMLNGYLKYRRQTSTA